MSKLIPLALIALVLAGAASAPDAMARNREDPHWVDQPKAYGGFAPDSQEGTRAFWDYMTNGHAR